LVVMVGVVVAAAAVVVVVHNGDNCFMLSALFWITLCRLHLTPSVSEINFNIIPYLRLCLPVGCVRRD